MPAHLTLLIGIIFCIQLFGQGPAVYQYRELSVSNGLPDPSVARITQDTNGYIWLATLNGITRYDGNRIRNYHPSKELDPQASNRDFPYLHVGNSGNLWVGYLMANHALFRYDVPQDSFMYFDPFEGTNYRDSLLSVRAILEDQHSNLWVATSKNGLFRILLSDQVTDTLEYHYYQHDTADSTSLPTNFMAPGIWQDPSGIVWLVTEAGLVEYRAGTDDFITHTWSDDPLENEGLTLTPDTARNCLWIGTFNGLVRFDIPTKQSDVFCFAEPMAKTDFPNFIPVVSLAPPGHLWVTRGSYPFSTLWVFKPDEESFYPVFADGLNSYDQLSGSLHQFTDGSGIIWSGNFHRGVRAIDPSGGNIRRVMIPSAMNPVPDFDESGIIAIAEYTPGIFFIGTKNQGVWKWDHRMVTLNRIEGFVPAFFTDSTEVNNLVLANELDLLWVFSSSGIYEYDIISGKSRLLKALDGPEEVKNYRAACFYDGWLWGSSLGQGAFRIKVGEVEKVDHFSPTATDSLAEFLPYGGITDIQPGIEPGQFWLSSVYGGVLEWRPDTGSFQVHPTPKDVRQIVLGAHGLLWLRCPGEIILYDPETLQQLTLPLDTERLLNHPLSMAGGAEEVIWVVTNSGLVAIDETKLSVVHHLSAPARLAGQEASSGGLTTSLSATGGKFYLANQKGFFVVDPEAISYNTELPRVALQTVVVNGRTQHLPQRTTDEIILGKESNNLTFTVAVLHFSSPEDNRLEYQLEGFDGEWKAEHPENNLVYYDLKPGRYRLRARGISGEGITGPIRELITIRIKPFWYASSLAYGLYLIIFLGICYGGFLMMAKPGNRSGGTSTHPTVAVNREHEFVLSARKVVLDNLAASDFGPDQLATALSLSRSQLHRRLNKSGEGSTTHFINATRLAEGKKKLTDPTLTIAEVAYDCGYSDPSYFSKKFREFYGMTPTKFREKS